LAQVRNDVDRAGGTRRLDALDHERVHRRLDRRHLSRRQRLRHEPAKFRVRRRIEEDHRHRDREPGRRELVVGDRETLRRRERFGVARRAPDVVEAREHPEVAVLDVVHGIVLT